MNVLVQIVGQVFDQRPVFPVFRGSFPEVVSERFIDVCLVVDGFAVESRLDVLTLLFGYPLVKMMPVATCTIV